MNLIRLYTQDYGLLSCTAFILAAINIIFFLLSLLIHSIEKNKSSGRIGMLCSLLSMGIGFPFITKMSFDKPDTADISLFLFELTLSLISFILIFIYFKRENKITAIEKFYAECVDLGITSLDTESNMERAKLVAEKYNFEANDILKLYTKGKELDEKKKIESQNLALNKQKNEEKNKLDMLNRYLGLYGREKRIAYLKEERDGYLNKSDTLKKGASATISMSQQKESDWAVLGGVANAIAGPAAGVSTAINTQAKNAEIRRQNQENLRALAPAMTNVYSEAKRLKNTAEEVDAEISKTATKLVQDIDNIKFDELFTTSKESYVISETGTMTLTVKIKAKEKPMIYDDVKAVFDGFIVADIVTDISDNDSIVGTVYLTLPKYGATNSGWTSLEGMDLYKYNNYTMYYAKYRINKLWKIEI